MARVRLARGAADQPRRDGREGDGATQSDSRAPPRSGLIAHVSRQRGRGCPVEVASTLRVLGERPMRHAVHVSLARLAPQVLSAKSWSTGPRRRLVLSLGSRYMRGGTLICMGVERASSVDPQLAPPWLDRCRRRRRGSQSVATKHGKARSLPLMACLRGCHLGPSRGRQWLPFPLSCHFAGLETLLELVDGPCGCSIDSSSGNF